MENKNAIKILKKYYSISITPIYINIINNTIKYDTI